MTVNQILDDKEFGHFYLKVNARAVRYTFKAANDGGRGILITVPPHYRVDDVKRAIEEMRPQLRELIERKEERQQEHFIDWSFRIESDCLHIRLEKGVGANFQYKHEMGEFVIDEHQNLIVNRPAELILLCPPDCDFKGAQRQAWLEKVIIEGIRMHARDQLVNRMRQYADFYRIPIHEIKVNISQSHWGSCVKHGKGTMVNRTIYYNINLSIYTLLLPADVQKLILLHELTHTRHMDHSPAFHHDLNVWLGGKEEALEQTLKAYHTNFWCFRK